MTRQWPRKSSHGYGRTHRRLRAAWAARVAAGGIVCDRCGKPIERGQQWDLGHQPGGRAAGVYAGPQHRECNRNTTDERGHADPAPSPRTKW